MEFSVEIDPTEMDFVLRQLQIIGNFDKLELPMIMDKIAKELYTKVSDYPPERAGQKYIRTNTYKESTFYDTETIPNGVQAIAGSHGAIQNGNRYDPYLKDERNQASIHSGRWTTLADDADSVMPMLERELQAAIRRMKL